MLAYCAKVKLGKFGEKAATEGSEAPSTGEIPKKETRPAGDAHSLNDAIATERPAQALVARCFATDFCAYQESTIPWWCYPHLPA